MGTKKGDSTPQNVTGKTCRVAYTLLNSQPVLCSIVSDQPLFYMDESADLEMEFEDDHDLMDLLLPSDTEIIATHSTNAVDRREEMQKESDQRFLDLWQDNMQDVIKISDLTSDVSDLMTSISKSRMAQTLLEETEQYGTKILYSKQTKRFNYIRANGLIQINPGLSRENQILNLVCALRMAWQHRNGVLVHPLMFHPDDSIFINRAQSADLCVAMIRVAWELKLSGDEAVWNRLLEGSFADMAYAFGHVAARDFRAMNNGSAHLIAFERWFTAERCQITDRTLIQQMLSDDNGYVFGEEKTSRNVSLELLAKLGDMPYGKNYLSQSAGMMIEDPTFTEVHDRSNANFLWFVKFERSFRETEQELQKKGSAQKGQKSKPDRDHEKEKIVQFPGQQQRSGDNAVNPDGMAEVYYLGSVFRQGGE